MFPTMKPIHRNRRLGLIAIGAVFLAGGGYLVSLALERNISYFYTPTEIAETGLSDGARIRLGGLVAEGSVQPVDDAVVAFKVTDGAHEVNVTYSGILPDLFREGQGVIAQGRFSPDNVFVADTILAKHDENYVPKELAETLGHPGS